MSVEWSLYPASLGHHPALFWHFARAYFVRIGDRLRLALPCRQTSQKNDVRARSRRFPLRVVKILILSARMTISAAHALYAASCPLPSLPVWFLLDTEEYVMKSSSPLPCLHNDMGELRNVGFAHRGAEVGA